MLTVDSHPLLDTLAFTSTFPGPLGSQPAPDCDAEGPCANAVKDAQRTKTSADTRRTLTVLWGAKPLGDRTARAFAWYRELLERLGATVERVP